MNCLLLLLCILLADDAKTEATSGLVKIREIQNKINGLDTELIRLENTILKAEDRQNRLSDDIADIELQRAVIHRKIEKFELYLDKAAEELLLNQEQQQTLQARATEQRQTLMKRLRGLYKRGSMGHAQLFLKQSELTDLINAYHYAKVLTERDKTAIAEFAQTLSDLKATEAELTVIKTNAEENRKNLDRENKKLKNLLRERQRRLANIRKEAKKQRKLLADFELEKEEMLLMVRRLTDENSDPMEHRIPVKRYKGKLTWPIEGKLLRKFGVYRDPEFQTKRKINGIDIIVPKGRAIRAIYSGRVIFADWFKNYGNLIILDHGERVTSFYAHCDRMNVQKGDYVERNAIIGLAGDTGSLDGSMLHFEIRNKTVPENPLSWLQKQSRSKKSKRRR